MAGNQPQPPTVPQRAGAAPCAGRFRMWQLTCWLFAATVLGLLMAWAAEATQATFAPLIIFPLVVGVVLGGLAVLLMRACRVGHRPTIISGTLLAVAITVVGQHYIGYIQAARRAEDSRPIPTARLLFPELHPASFGEYMRSQIERGRPLGRGNRRITGGWAWASWSLDAVLVLIPTLLLVTTAARLPYCNTCQKWYHTIRAKRIDVCTVRQLSEAVGLTDLGEPSAKSPRYRLIDCDGNCGPMGLALFWSDARGDFSSGYIWLTAEQRKQVLEIVFK